MRDITWTVRYASTVMLLAVLGCGKGGDKGGGITGTEKPVPVPATISLSVASSSVTVVQGSSGSVDVAVTRGGGYAGAVTLSTQGLPAGVTATPGSPTTSGTTTSASIAVAASASATPGTYTVTVTGEGTGVSSASGSFTLIVQAAPDFTVTVNPTAVLLNQGASRADIAITMGRTNLTTPIALALTGTVPAGVTASFAPVDTAGGAVRATMTVSVATTTPVGVYTLAISGTATPGTRSAAFTLTVAELPRIAMTLSPANGLTLQTGTSDNSRTITLARTNYAGVVTLVAEGLPSGVTATFTPNGATGNTSQLTVTAASNAPVRSAPYDVTLRASGPDIASVTVSLPLTLTAPPPPPTLAISISPQDTVTVPRRSVVTTRSVSIARANFTGPVSLSVENVPAGVTVSFSETSTNAANVALTLSATDAAALTGSPVSVVIRATAAAGGGLVSTATLRLSVVSAGSVTMTTFPDGTCENVAYLRPGMTSDYFRIRLNRTNYPDAVTFEIQDLPAGVTGQVEPLAGRPNDYALHLTAAGSAPATVRNITVVARGPLDGSGVPQVQLSVRIQLSLYAASTADVSQLISEFDGNTNGWSTESVCNSLGGKNWGRVIVQDSHLILDGTDDFPDVGQPNSWVMRSVALPSATRTMEIVASAHFTDGGDARLRVRAWDGNTFTTLLSTELAHTGATSVLQPNTFSIDVSSLAGKTVLFFVEQDSNGYKGVARGNGEQIWIDRIRFIP